MGHKGGIRVGEVLLAVSTEAELPQALKWLSSLLHFSGNFCHHHLILREGLHEEINQRCSLVTEKHIGLFTLIYNGRPLAKDKIYPQVLPLTRRG